MAPAQGGQVEEGYFKTRLAPDPNREKVWSVVVPWLQRFIPPNAAVLDVGAGYCTFINQVRAAERHAVDVAPLVTEHAAPGVIAHVAPSYHMQGVPSAHFDVVFESFLFEHLTREELADTLAEILRVLKPGGRLLAAQPNFYYAYRRYFDDYTHRLVFTHTSLADRLVAAGFELERVFPRFLPFSLRSALPTFRPLVWLYLHSPLKPCAGNMLIVCRKPAGGQGR
jgi:SAM-dependent methyltransferase